MSATRPEQKYVPFPLQGQLDQEATPIFVDGFVTAQNLVYQRHEAIGKRTGTGPYGGAGTVGTGKPVISGVRWYAGQPSVLKSLIVQSNDGIYLGTDVGGTFAKIGTLTASSTPAFYAGVFDATNTGGAAMNSDILVIAYGSGQPKKWDGTNFTNLSASITNPFTGCTFWHQHVWFWGDPSFPDTLWATDLANPEGFVFMNTFSPPGYIIGQGDGDPTIQCAIGSGNVLCAFKTNSIYAVSGFDFLSSEYPFQISPLVLGNGTPSPHSVVAMPDGAVVWWNGLNFYEMYPGLTNPTAIGDPITNEIAIAANNSQSAIRAVGGDFFLPSTIYGPGNYNNFYMCAIDSGTGLADTILVYDRSQRKKKPAWTVWTGLTIGSFIPFNGPGDQRILYFGSAASDQVSYLGQNSMNDAGSAITVMLQTGKTDYHSPNQIKEMDRLWVNAEANTATFQVQVISDQSASSFAAAQLFILPQGGIWGVGVWGTMLWGPSAATSYQSAEVNIDPALRGLNFTFLLVESSATSAYELTAVTSHAIEEAYSK